MNKYNYRKQLHYVIETNGLHNRDTFAANILTAIENGLFSETQARAMIFWAQELADNVAEQRNYLDRAPDQDEINPNGDPDLIVGKLVESGAYIGYCLDDAINSIYVGNTGSGKTTAMYNVILAVNQYNQNNPDDFISLIIQETKDGSLLAVPKVMKNCVVVNTDTTMRISLHPPRGYPYKNWNNRLGGDIIPKWGKVKAGAISIIEMLNFLAEVMNPTSPNNPIIYPTFENLYELSTMAPKGLFESKEQYQLSINQVLRQYAKATADLFRSHRGLDLEDDIIAHKKHLIIDARGLWPDWVRATALDILLARLLLGREYRNEQNPRRCIILLDEADTQLSSKVEGQYQS